MFSHIDKHGEKKTELTVCSVCSERFGKLWKKIIHYSGKARGHAKETFDKSLKVSYFIFLSSKMSRVSSIEAYATEDIVPNIIPVHTQQVWS